MKSPGWALAIGWCALSLVLTAAPASEGRSGEKPLPLGAASIRLADWGLEQAAAIRVGRLAESVGAEGAGLDVHALWQAADLAASARVPPRPAAPSAGSVAQRKLKKAILVWETEEILASRRQMRRLVTFVSAHGFTDVFLQIPRQPGAPTRITSEPRQVKRLRRLLARLKERGIATHALDGDRSYARPERHQEVVEGVQSIARFNRAAAPNERFVGVHYDIEPYLLPGFGSARRGELLLDFLVGLELLAAAAREHGLEAGVDIPFWFDSRDQDTGRDMAVELGGTSARPFEHIIDMMDNIGIMDYRTRADGDDGVIAHARTELEYAAEKGKKVLIGLETHPLPDQRHLKFSGEPTPEPPSGLGPEDGLVVAVDDGETAWLHVAGLARVETLAADLERLRAAGTQVLFWEVESAIQMPASRVTFADADPATLEQVRAAAEQGLLEYPAFAGFAIHHYGSYRSFLER